MNEAQFMFLEALLQFVVILISGLVHIVILFVLSYVGEQCRALICDPRYVDVSQYNMLRRYIGLLPASSIAVQFLYR